MQRRLGERRSHHVEEGGCGFRPLPVNGRAIRLNRSRRGGLPPTARANILRPGRPSIGPPGHSAANDDDLHRFISLVRLETLDGFERLLGCRGAEP